MGSIVNVSCELEFNDDFKNYPKYNHFNFVMTASYVFNKNGILPFDGPLGSQPAQIMEILETIMALDSERENDARLKAERDSKKRG